MNQPIYKINGKDRKSLKKELSKLKYIEKYFVHYHLIDKEMAFIFGSTNTYPMSDKDAAKQLINLKLKILKIQEQLKELI